MIDDPAARKVLDAVGRLEEACRRADASPVAPIRKRTVVTEAVLERLARSPWASPELHAFASTVAAGGSTWDRIEVDARPIPPEVSELRADPSAGWPPNWPIEADDQPYRIPWQ
ncbi:hypothetical protein [Rhodococcoides kyotonense]|uniref:Uncharacterized protein n=1 Tax=Rhodococcoides kyotonense TaxID=398843 RepID=A0A239LCS8_9NOCA|nr:hypothetical protein [Rhodococcus kyotonensis]SNT27762.1 hypothetical protein SAMN05421642_112185 [Rhodococcus kyotonensis]